MEKLNEFYPVRACRKLAELPLPPSKGLTHTRVITHFNHGGWCKWSMDQQNPNNNFLVTGDGRTQFVPSKQYEMQYNLFGGKKNWKKILNRWSPSAVVTPSNAALTSLIRTETDWKIFYEDAGFVVFIRI